MIFYKMDKETLGKELTILRIKLTETNKQIIKIFNEGDYWDFLHRIGMHLLNADTEIVEQAKLCELNVLPPTSGSVLGNFYPLRRKE